MGISAAANHVAAHAPAALAARRAAAFRGLPASASPSTFAAAARLHPRRSAVTMASSTSSGQTTTTPEKLKKLQNGSDVRGVALDGVPGEAVTLNEEAAYLIGGAFVEWLAVGPGRYCSPRHRMNFNFRNEGSKCVGRRGVKSVLGPRWRLRRARRRRS